MNGLSYGNLAGMSPESIGPNSFHSQTNTHVSQLNEAGIVVIESRALVRECLTDCFIAAFGPVVKSYSSVQDWITVVKPAPWIVVLSTGGREQDADEVQVGLELLSRLDAPLTLILLADAEEPHRILRALQQGVRGYIPTSSSLMIAIEAVRLVRAGGVYIPANSLIASGKHKSESTGTSPRRPDILLTDRQLLVLEALHKGKSNKAIAFELNIHESTVKVHVRNIMKKLGARNRTQVAYLARTQLSLP
jgi:DNA-binding NarL/FixJ family response regulator